MTKNLKNTADLNTIPIKDRAPNGINKIISFYIITVCCFSVFVGIIGNLVVLIVRAFKKSQRKEKAIAYNFLVSQLAIADLLFAFTVIFDIHEYLHENKWIFDVHSCRIINSMQLVSFTTTVGFLTVMSYERYRGITKPLHHRWSIKKASVIVFGIWVYSFILASPYMVTLQITIEGYCSESHDVPKVLKQIYTLVIVLATYILPLSCIIFFNILSTIYMKKHIKSIKKLLSHTTPSSVPQITKNEETELRFFNQDSIRGSGTKYATDIHKGNITKNLHSRISQDIQSFGSREDPLRSTPAGIRIIPAGVKDRKLINMLVAMTVSFALLVLPSSFWYLWHEFHPSPLNPDDSSSSDKYFSLFIQVFVGLVYLQCCSNCIIYSLMDKRFHKDARNAFRQIFHSISKKLLFRKYLR